MAFVKIWVHVVWATKNREPLLSKIIRKSVFDHIRSNASSKGIYIDFINGYFDHVHCLISLKPDQSIAKTVQLIKGESAYWINKQKMTKSKFGWQKEYFAMSVSDSNINSVRNYIRRQEEHHKKKTFQDEYNGFMNQFGFDRFSG